VTSITQSHPNEHSRSIADFAMESVDAYDMAHDAVSDLYSIFEVLDNLTKAELCNDRISRILFRAGCQHAAERLKVIDKKIAEATKELEELAEAEYSDNDD
jgi:hypothetical protein